MLDDTKAATNVGMVLIEKGRALLTLPLLEHALVVGENFPLFRLR
jgi:hypothetical protein